LHYLAKNQVARELEAISRVLDENQDILDLAYPRIMQQKSVEIKLTI